MALQLNSQTEAAIAASRPTANWNLVCHITYTRDTWVKLLHSPTEYAADEAKLLCQESADAWVAWVPDHGEVVLDRRHFYC
ncbi:hypothetical protein [Nodosilinea sp. E11]|uniref:hypothetical protein n=1 Tax=Nodosilinea sp. E11 TaxID=3037479 RepID=UPI0029349CC9|nr:hypothetical protein [Nodosilinea sp. E11]WOD40259.1 hypothetical protein RRF56_05570 [Nodosilinea sp. E11]